MIDANYPVWSRNYIEITERRAPTDESVRLLREMEKEALAKITNLIELNNNDFSAKVLISEHGMDFLKRGLIIFSLNGRRHMVEITFGVSEDTEESMVNRCLCELSKYLATEILKSVGKFD